MPGKFSYLNGKCLSIGETTEDKLKYYDIFTQTAPSLADNFALKKALDGQGLQKKNAFWDCVYNQILQNTPMPQFAAGSPLAGMNTLCDSQATMEDKEQM